MPLELRAVACSCLDRSELQPERLGAMGRALLTAAAVRAAAEAAVAAEDAAAEASIRVSLRGSM